MITIVNKYKHTPTANDVYVGRGSPLGNPYVAKTPDMREQVCDAYEKGFPTLLKSSELAQDMVERFIQRELRGAQTNLVCYCAPKRCHTETIKSYVEKELARRLLAPIRLIIASGRDFNNQDIMVDAINDISKDWNDGDVVIISGMAEGADKLGHQLALGNGIPVLEFPADWKDMSEPCLRKTGHHGEYNALAGMKRNIAMRKAGTHLLAFWDGKSSGTKDMVAHAIKAKLEMTIVRY